MLDKKKIQEIYNKIQEMYNKMPDHIGSFDLKKFLGNKKLMKRIAWVLVIIFLVFHVRGCIQERRRQAVPPRPVQTAIAVKKDVPIYIDDFGTLSPINSANISPQVSGEVKEVHFKEGDEVKMGDILFVIDPAPYKAALDKAQAALAEANVDLKLKKDTLERNRQLFEKELISQQDFDQYQTDVAAAEAEVELDKADVETAKINLAYCYIHAPVSGRTGKRQVDIGNIVTANSGTVLVNIKTIDNLYVDFNVPERNLPGIRGSMDAEKLKIEVTIDGDEGGPYTGELNFLDNTVDDTTGTVFLRGILPNGERKLWSGQFVQVRLFLGMEKDATVVPYTAVQLGKQGEYLFAVTPKNKADLRIVTIGPRDDEDLVVEKGVEPGEKVVTVGQMGLSPGVPVVDVTPEKKEEEKKRSGPKFKLFK